MVRGWELGLPFQAMKIRWVLLVFLTCLSAARSLPAQNKRPVASEQTVFSAEDSGVKRPVSIPEDVMAILRKDEGVLPVLDYENVRPENLPASWFSAAEVHLTLSSTPDLVVAAEPPLAGGNVDTFWVFRATAHGHELMVTAPAHSLALKSTRSHGYRDIELLSNTAVAFHTVILRFDGTEYKVLRDKWAPIK